MNGNMLITLAGYLHISVLYYIYFVSHPSELRQCTIEVSSHCETNEASMKARSFVSRVAGLLQYLLIVIEISKEV
jgi:hypothetical protein